MVPVRAKIPFAAVLPLALAAAPALAALPHTETFDTDEGNFQGSTTATVQIYSATGGNPDGHVVIRKDVSSGFDIGTEDMASPEFLGNYAVAGIDNVGFDVRPDTAFDEVWLRFRDAVTTNGWYYDVGALPDDSTWRAYDLPIDPAWSDATALGNGWTQEAGAPSWAETFNSVGWIEVRVINDASALAGVDNVRITPTPATIALPALALAATTRRRR